VRAATSGRERGPREQKTNIIYKDSACMYACIKCMYAYSHRYFEKSGTVDTQNSLIRRVLVAREEEVVVVVVWLLLHTARDRCCRPANIPFSSTIEWFRPTLYLCSENFFDENKSCMPLLNSTMMLLQSRTTDSSEIRRNTSTVTL